MKKTWELWIEACSRINAEQRTGLASSYPLPVVQRTQLLMGVFQVSCEPDPKRGLRIAAPRALLFLDAETGDEVVVTDADERLARASRLPATGWVRMRFRPSEYRPRIVELCSLYDALVPLFHRGVPPARDDAATYLDRLATLSPGMMAYYRSAAPEFFQWLQP